MISIQRPPCPDPASLQSQASYKSPANKSALVGASNGKCMYCEAYITHAQFGDVEHIRPKAVYPELEFVWENLGICCAVCNNAKKNAFDEGHPFVNPYAENPSAHLFAYGAHVLPVAGSLRGRLTVDTMKLNRPQLIERRSDRISQIERAMRAVHDEQNALLREKAVEIIAEESGHTSEYSMVAGALVAAMMPAIAA